MLTKKRNLKKETRKEACEEIIQKMVNSGMEISEIAKILNMNEEEVKKYY